MSILVNNTENASVTSGEDDLFVEYLDLETFSDEGEESSLRIVEDSPFF